MSASRKAPKAGFEASLHRLEEIVQRLEQGDVPLEESLTIYEEGVRLSRQCLEQLRDAELRLKTLARNEAGQFILNDDEGDLPPRRPTGGKDSA